MASEWRATTLGEVIELKRGYDLPTRSRRPGPYPVVSSSGTTDTHADFKAAAPGVVTGRYGTIGEVYYLTTDYWPLNTALYVRDFKGNDPRFISYFLRGIDFVSYSDKSAVPGVNRNHLHQAEVIVPPLPVQRRIAEVLGALDDRIELNRRMNRTLEAMAAAIFKSWFIDFDPVHAKAEGRDSNLPAEIANLFPDTFEDSDLGPIPKGWTPGKLGDAAENPRRTVQPSDVPPATPYIGLQHMPRRCIALDAWGRADEVGSGKSQFKEGEILFGKLRPYFHKVGIAPVDGVCSTDILVVVPKSPEWHSYVLSLVSSKAFVDYTDSHSAGTKMPRTNWKDMGRYPLALPPEPLAKAFQDHVAALHQRIGLAVRQNRRLAGLRDTLLPRLLSGEIELPEAEELTEGAI
jgi:type I restriction enzyme S subunit